MLSCARISRQSPDTANVASLLRGAAGADAGDARCGRGRHAPRPWGSTARYMSPLGRGPEPSGLPRSFVTYLLVCVCVFLFLHARPIRAQQQPPSPLRCKAPGGLDLQFDPDGCQVCPSYAGMRLGIRR
ncbi:hypothetical protein LY78DRAFT_652872 [Colletotrichum sublineola]|nr:hypothetical protein LY78DRAFT_652872 [Colletotrichum sublineola]